MFKEDLLNLTYEFALSILRLTKRMYKEREFVVSNQLARSGTSIGANVREAQYAQSQADFISKMKIALKEAAETKYWIDLTFDTNLITHDEHENLSENIDHILRMLTYAAKITEERYTSVNR